jgi:ABC-type sugar transport system permease subunit
MSGSGQRLFGLLLVAPALALVTALFLVPLGYSVGSAFTQPDGAIGLANFARRSSFIPATSPTRSSSWSPRPR